MILGYSIYIWWSKYSFFDQPIQVMFSYILGKEPAWSSETFYNSWYTKGQYLQSKVVMKRMTSYFHNLFSVLGEPDITCKELSPVSGMNLMENIVAQEWCTRGESIKSAASDQIFIQSWWIFITQYWMLMKIKVSIPSPPSRNFPTPWLLL